MKILILGSGGREDAYAWKFQQEENVQKVYVSPGHAAMDRFSKVEVLGKKNQTELMSFALENKIDLTVVGPEAPLTEGIKDLFEKNGLALFGPNEKAAQLEGSKIFSKEFMIRNAIPTANSEVYDSYESAKAGLDKWPMQDGIVIKADGLAGGKGVVVTKDRRVAEDTLHDFMVNEKVSVKSERILFEVILPGEEVSTFALCSREDFFFLGSACDHKRVFDNDEGPNKGGMGCFHTSRWPDEELTQKIKQRILIPTLKGCQKEGMPFSGFLFMGLMVNSDGDPFVIEYNVRMGDPETQTLFPLMEGSLSETLEDLLKGRKTNKLSLREKASVHVVMTSEGYPSIDNTPMNTKNPITLPEKLDQECELFLAGVSRNSQGELINAGGRVLGVTALADDLSKARELAYKQIEKISFAGMHYRKDIGAKERGL